LRPTSARDSAGRAYRAAPDSLAVFERPLREEGEGKRKERRKNGRKGKKSVQVPIIDDGSTPLPVKELQKWANI